MPPLYGNSATVQLDLELSLDMNIQAEIIKRI